MLELTHNRRLKIAALASSALVGLAMIGAPSAQATGGGYPGGGGSGPSTPKVVADGLDNPRQLSFTRSGELLIAEAGEGGAGPCISSPEGGDSCFGKSGAITLLSHGHQFRIIKGLPSFAGKDTGESAVGPTDVAATHGKLAVLLGLGAPPAARHDMPAAAQKLGTLVTYNWSGKSTVLADLAAWEDANNPIADKDSNPVGLLADGNRYIVADAGGNSVLSVGRGGKIKLLASFDSRLVEFPPGSGQQMPMQAVPTSVATKGWDGAYYVSQLTGFPFPKGGASIYRIDPRTHKVTVYATGLTNVTDLAFNGRTLYAVQIATNGLLAGSVGSVVKVKRGGTTPADLSTVAADLEAPYGIAINHGSAYVTVHSTSKDTGQVLRIKL